MILLSYPNGSFGAGCIAHSAPNKKATISTEDKLVCKKQDYKNILIGADEKMDNQKSGVATETEKDSLYKYRQLKNQLEEIQRNKKSKTIIFLWIATLLITVVASAVPLAASGYPLPIVIPATIATGILFGSCVVAYIHMLLDMQESAIRRKMIEFEVAETQNEISDDIFKNSIKMSYKYLDQYYNQTREHANRGFAVTVGVSLFGALLIFGGIIGMFLGSVEPAYITCAVGTITEFIAAVFFYLYNKTVSSMSQYHNKLVLSQDISIALKVADSLPTNDQVKAKSDIINELIKDINIYLVKEDPFVGE